LREKLDLLLQQDVIEPVDASPWLSPIHIVQKGEKLRLTLDLRYVNSQIVVEYHPMPLLLELVSACAGAKYYSAIDLSQAYHQVVLEEDSRDITGFVTCFGTFRYRRLCFGLASAPAFFQRLMDQLLRGLHGVAWYLDDVLVWGTTLKEHDVRLSAVFQKLAATGLRVAPGKCQLGVQKVIFLGHELSEKGVFPLKRNLDAIQKAPRPTQASEVASFLGFCGFYHRFVPDFATVAQPLRELTRKSAEWRWEEDQEAAWLALKEALTIAAEQGLKGFQPGQTTILTADASDKGIGAILSQRAPGDGPEVPVAYYSRALTATERNYSVGERETLAIIEGCERWHCWLYGTAFRIRTDHQALVTLLSASTQTRTTMRIARWVTRLLRYVFTIEYIRSAGNPADFLSRLPVDSGSLAEVVGEPVVSDLVAAIDINIPDLAAATLADQVAQRVFDYIRMGWPRRVTDVDPELYPFWRLKDELTVQQSLLLRGPQPQVYVPADERPAILTLAHSGHPGIVRMKNVLRQSYWWPGASSDAEEYVRNCDSCKFADKTQIPRAQPIQPLPWPEGPWHTIAVDLVGPVATMAGAFVIVVIDLYSKYPEISVRETCPDTVDVETFLRELFDRFGTPVRLISDNGPQFRSERFEDFLRSQGTRHTLTTPYHPQSNGEVERFNRVIMSSVKAAERDNARMALSEMIRAYRTTPHTVTGVTPSELMFGRLVRTPLTTPCDGVRLNREPPPPDATLRPRVEAQQRAMCERGPAGPATVFSPGDTVMVRKNTAVPKGTSKFRGPHRVSRLNGYQAILDDGTRVHVSSLSRIRPGERPDPGIASEESSVTTESAQEERCAARPGRPSRVRRTPVHLQDYHF
jgi:transposase InsO family protein